MTQAKRAEKYLQLFLDAVDREKNALKNYKYYWNLREKETFLDWFGKPDYHRKQAEKYLKEAKSARAAKIKIHKTLVSILGVLKNEK